jgi:A/G-specific adenine glycosylase
MGVFLQYIYSWYKKSKRELPWRETTEPYRIWLSEIILQQTRVDQGKSYYLKLIEKFPTIKNLSEAEED